jgi:hypothetical protein
MNEWIIGAIIWLAGALISFRWEARRLVARENYRRAKAIKEARDEAMFWPIRVLAVIAETAWVLGKAVVLAGIPESRADRDEAIKRLEDEVLGASAEDARDEAAGQLHLSLQEALNGTTADEDAEDLQRLDSRFLEALDRSGKLCGPDTKMPSGKTLTSIRPAYLPRNYQDGYRAGRDAEATYEAVTKARRAVELLERLRALGMRKDPATGHEVSKALRKARQVLQDAESGRLVATQLKETKTQVYRLERVLKAQEITQGTNAKTCTRCGCPVVQGRLGYIHIPTLGCPPPCDRATIAPVPWYLTPENSPEREAVRRRTDERLRQMDEDRATAATMRELQEEFPVPLEPDVIRSISLDGTETEIQITRLQAEGYSITYLNGTQEAIRRADRRITEWFEDSTLPITRKIHREQHADAPNTLCPFCNLEALS